MTERADPVPPPSKWWPTSRPQLPPPDSKEGLAIAAAVCVAAAYLFLLVGSNSILAGEDGAWVPLLLILATVVAFAVGSMLESDFSRIQMVELELARTISVHRDADQLPESDSSLGKVLREFARTSAEMRRHARTHSYAFGPALWGAVCALGGAMLWGLSLSTNAPWVNSLGLVVELPAMALLFFAITVLFVGVGADRPVPAFEGLVPRRWHRRLGESSPPIAQVVAELPWLSETPTSPDSGPAAVPMASPVGATWHEGPPVG